MPNSTCRFLSNGYKFQYLDNSLRLRPCCHFSEHIEITDSNDNEIAEFRNRINAMDPYTDLGCQRCAYNEKKNLRKTWRQLSFDIVPDHAQYGDAHYLEIQLDNTCNGGCIMCGPKHSSFWANELVKNNLPVVPIQRQDRFNRILEIIDIQKPNKILFLGGEPFLSDVDQRLLPLINRPENVSLQYTTNGSIYPSQDRINLWKRFKSVLINFSIDGIGDRFEYIRYPLKWHTVRDNMFNLRDSMPDNVEFKINHTVNILSLYYWSEFNHWQQNNFLRDRFNRPIVVSFNPADGPLSPYIATEKLYSQLANKYSQDSLPCKTVKHQIKELPEVVKYLNQLDQRRNQNWQTTFPDIATCL